MTKTFGHLLAALAITAATGAAAQQYSPPPPPPGQYEPPRERPNAAPPPQYDQQYADGEEQAPPPPQAAPRNLPPAPPVNVAPAPGVSAPAQEPLPPPPPRQGEWIYTAQYGWIWAPYGQRYTYVVDGTDTASMYVYYPAYGWRWVAAPWVLGFGPVPRWGRFGPRRFVWYSRPWFHRRVVIGPRHRVVVRHRRW
jgi:hypothetical protein